MLMMQTVKPADSFQGVVEFLATELFNPNTSINVRKIVQSCLALLASERVVRSLRCLNCLSLCISLCFRLLYCGLYGQRLFDQQASYVACGFVYVEI